ncbi:type II toxin-antitoxin system HicB family antitoxin [Candidatus Acetothermia bacterium]|nr:type II toxin-antitoxin system HicB family antitoxin [Candidatus Acetothermia bacterium]
MIVLRESTITSLRAVCVIILAEGERNLNRAIQKIRYEVIIYWSKEDNAFIAEVPELPGCMADGATYQEALANVEVVIQEWIETAKELGRPLPEPKGRLIFA